MLNAQIHPTWCLQQKKENVWILLNDEKHSALSNSVPAFIHKFANWWNALDVDSLAEDSLSSGLIGKKFPHSEFVTIQFNYTKDSPSTVYPKTQRHYSRAQYHQNGMDMITYAENFWCRLQYLILWRNINNINRHNRRWGHLWIQTMERNRLNISLREASGTL